MATSYPKITQFSQSQNTTNAKKHLEVVKAAKPGQYSSQYAQQTKAALSAITDRKAFQYDVNEDALYQQMKDNYIAQGRLAMQDTMGQAATMTGGYGNSYAQGVGQQAYQGYLKELNDNVPQLQAQALQTYQAEGDRLADIYNALAGQEAQDYSRYQDNWSRWLAEQENAQQQYESSLDRDRGVYESDRDYAWNEYVNNRDYQYTADQREADLARSQIDAMLSNNVVPNADLIKRSGYDQQYIDQAVARFNPGYVAPEKTGGSGGGSGGSGGDSGGSGGDSGSSAPTFGEIGQTAANLKSSGGDVNEYLNEMRKGGYITAQQQKSLKKTFGY